MAKFQEIESAVTSLDKQIEKLAGDLKGLVGAVNSNSKSQEQLANKTNKLKKASVQVDKVEKERLALLAKLKIANSGRIQQNEEIKLQLQKQKKVNKDLAKSKLGLVSLYEKESKKLKDLKKRYKDVALSQGAGSKAAKKLATEVKHLDGKLKKVDASSGDFQRNIGNYPGLMGRMGSSIQGVSAQFKALLANPIVATIAAIAGAFIVLTKAMKRSESGQNTLNKISAALGASLNVLMDIITALAEGMFKAFEDPKESVKNLWEVIKINLVNRIKGVADLFVNMGEITAKSFKLIGQSLAGIWKDNEAAITETKKAIKEDAKEMAAAFIQMNTGFDKGQQDNILKGFKSITKEIKEEAAIAAALAKQQALLDKLVRNSGEKQAENRKKINLLREVAAKKEEFDAKTRLEALDAAISLENDNLILQEKVAAAKLQIKAVQNDLGASTTEDLKEESDLRIALIDLEASAAKRRKLLQSERVTAMREVAAEEEAIINATIDKEIANSDAEIERLKLKIDAKALLEKEAAQKELDELKAIEDAKKAVKIAAAESTAGILSELAAVKIDENLAAFQSDQDAKADVLKNRLDKGEISEKQYEAKIAKLQKKSRIESAKAEKKKALLDAGLAAIVAVIKQLAATPLPVGAPAIAAAAAIGVIQVAAVAAKPIPKFKHGTNGVLQLDTTAEVGDGGERELITTPQGSYLSPNTATQVHLPKGSQVFSGADTKEILEKEKDNNGVLISEIKAMRNDFKNQPKSITNITDAGFEKIFINKGVTQHYLDEWVRL